MKLLVEPLLGAQVVAIGAVAEGPVAVRCVGPTCITDSLAEVKLACVVGERVAGEVVGVGCDGLMPGQSSLGGRLKSGGVGFSARCRDGYGGNEWVGLHVEFPGECHGNKLMDRAWQS